MPHTTTDQARVDGARLHLQFCGDGPPLLLVSGGFGDAGLYDPIAPVLGRHHTVISYDRRGNSRSPLDGTPGPMSMAQQSDDAVAVLDHLGVDSALVFGSSGGAIITLDLVARHPTRVRAAIAHEGAMVALLPDDHEIHEVLARIAAETDAGDIEAALAGLLAEITSPDRPHVDADFSARIGGNAEQLMARELPGFIRFHPDISELGKARVPLALAAGSENRGRWYYEPARILAREIRVDFVEFPGYHVGYRDLPDAFAETMRETFQRLGVAGQISARNVRPRSSPPPT